MTAYSKDPPMSTAGGKSARPGAAINGSTPFPGDSRRAGFAKESHCPGGTQTCANSPSARQVVRLTLLKCANFESRAHLRGIQFA